MTVIHTTNLSKSYSVGVRNESSGFFRRLKRSMRRIDAVRDVNLEVQEGEALAFLGPNGAGKSTTIKLLSGILHPDGGSAEVLGLVPWKDRRQLACQIGSVFGQKSQLWYHLPPADSFELLGAIYEIDRKVLARRTGELVERFGLADLMAVPVRKLSLGQRIRCEIAASLLHEPRILFLDEPTIGLDVVVKEEIRQLLREWNTERKVTLFLTSHDLGDVEKLCRRAVLIHHGAVVLDQGLRELRAQAGRNKILGVRFRTMPAGGLATILSTLGLRHQPDLSGVAGSGLAGAGGTGLAGTAGEGSAGDQGGVTGLGGLEPRLPVRVLKQGDRGVKLLVDTRQMPVQQVLQALVLRAEVEDFTVEDEPLEKLVGDLYRSRSREEAHALANQ